MIALLPHFLQVDCLTGDVLSGGEMLLQALGFLIAASLPGAFCVLIYLFLLKPNRSVTLPAVVVPFPSRSTDEAA